MSELTSACLLQEPELLVLSTMLEALEEVIDQGCSLGLISQQHLAVVCERLQAVLTASLHRRSERDERQQRDDYDEEEAEALEVRLLPASCIMLMSKPHVWP